ncbi:metallophosphoesterase family protein [Paenibacillus sp. YIM B09110]|uniref:metallophosphoesterase family protein n=1 Tax=Paenibacillus sp. YIM B09110 TaxID=3126102 RepID=UPI00301D7479
MQSLKRLFSLTVIIGGMFVFAIKTDGTTEIPLLRFSVMSDIHISAKDRESHTRFVKALRDHLKINPNSSLLVLNGDLTNGKEEDYRMLDALSGKVLHPPIHATIGNHEYYKLWIFENKSLRLNPDWSSEQAKNLFQNSFGYSKPYHHLWLNGCHFIFLGSERYRDVDRSVSENAFLSVAQLSWLTERLQEKPSALYGKEPFPIFVFLHQPLFQTVDGSESRLGVVQFKQLQELLQQYPDLILFSGHTHMDLVTTRQLVYKGFYSVGTGAIRKVKSHSKRSESLVVEVYRKRIIIKYREHSTKRWIYPNKSVYYGS